VELNGFFKKPINYFSANLNLKKKTKRLEKNILVYPFVCFSSLPTILIRGFRVIACFMLDVIYASVRGCVLEKKNVHGGKYYKQ
jgi:hypothetical protein